MSSAWSESILRKGTSLIVNADFRCDPPKRILVEGESFQCVSVGREDNAERCWLHAFLKCPLRGLDGAAGAPREPLSVSCLQLLACGVVEALVASPNAID